MSLEVVVANSTCEVECVGCCGDAEEEGEDGIVRDESVDVGGVSGWLIVRIGVVVPSSLSIASCPDSMSTSCDDMVSS